jgi:hypothetical protein
MGDKAALPAGTIEGCPKALSLTCIESNLNLNISRASAGVGVGVGVGDRGVSGSSTSFFLQASKAKILIDNKINKTMYFFMT